MQFIYYLTGNIVQLYVAYALTINTTQEEKEKERERAKIVYERDSVLRI